MVPWLMCPLEMLRCAGASPRSDGVGGCQHLSLCKCRERKTEVKQSLVEQVAGRAVISLLLPQTHYLQQSINPSVPKNTSSGFLWHCLTAACLQLSKPYKPYCLLTALLLSPLHFQSFHFSSLFHILFFPVSFPPKSW